MPLVCADWADVRSFFDSDWELKVPVYEYTCQKCQKRFDQLVRSMSNETTPKCPECGSPKTTKALSVFAVGAEGAGKSSGGDDPMCGRCGGAPGSCQM